MDQEQKMISNLEEKFGKPLNEWISLVKAQGDLKHGQIIKFLKAEHGFTHGFANLVAHKSLKSDAGSSNEPDLIDAQYKGKEHFRPLFESLKKEILAFGSDVELAPKKSYVSLRRKKQFGMLIPATKGRFEIGINLKGQEAEGALQLDTKTNGMCSHKIHLSSSEDGLSESIQWLKKAYDNAG